MFNTETKTWKHFCGNKSGKVLVLGIIFVLVISLPFTICFFFKAIDNTFICSFPMPEVVEVDEIYVVTGVSLNNGFYEAAEGFTVFAWDDKSEAYAVHGLMFNELITEEDSTLSEENFYELFDVGDSGITVPVENIDVQRESSVARVEFLPNAKYVVYTVQESETDCTVAFIICPIEKNILVQDAHNHRLSYDVTGLNPCNFFRSVYNEICVNL